MLWRGSELRLLGVWALVLLAGSLAGCEEQGWSASERSFFYYASQGSRLIRRDWFLALERHDSQELFLADGLQRFGYLRGEADARNPDNLPIGFAVDPPQERTWIGPNCAACHTSEISYAGKTVRVDGAPASADLFEFLVKLDLALQKAAKDDAAFERFAARVLGANNTPANRAALRDDADPEKGLRAFSDKFKEFVIESTPTAPLKWGPARVDAFGMIFNRIARIDLDIKDNNEPPNAPVSYPFLWGTSWHDFTQWNGAIDNDGGPITGRIHRLARNVGQVLGVFGTVNFSNPPPYPSSVQKKNLLQLEETVAKLIAPRWPDALGVPDPDKVARGRDLYQRVVRCVDCHQLVPPDRQLEPVKVEVVPQSRVRTDPAMTTMAATRRVKDSGVLKGRPLDPSPLRHSRPIDANELVHELLSHAVTGVMLPRIFSGATAATGAGSDADAISPSQLPRALFNASVNTMSYKARPLNGVWATGPFLHNGSVRTLYQLLLPPAQREARFHVGSREFDAVNVGFADKPGVIDFVLDTTLPGNLNTGHQYGTGLADDDRRALIEFLKTL